MSRYPGIFTSLILLLLSSCGNNDSALYHLDKIVSDNDSAINRRVEQLRSRARRVASQTLSPADRFALEMEMSNLNVDFNLDSALVHINRAIASSTPDSPENIRARLRLASIYNTSLLMYKEASDIFNELGKTPLPDSLRSDYYTLGVQIYRNLENQSALSSLSDKYRQLKQAYRDSVLSLTPESPFILANKLADNGDIDRAISIIASTLPSNGYSPSNGAAYHQLAGLYTLNGNRDSTLHFLILASQADLDNGVREYKALPQLALMLYEDGDIDRAYKYIHRSFNDARASNARLRILELSAVMPVVESAHNMAREQATNTLIIIIGAIFIIALILIEVLLIVRKRNRMLRQAREELINTNSRLTRTDAVKERYVTQYMHQSLDYLSKMERYRAELYKLATLKDYEKLTDVLSTGRYVNREIADFYTRFDDAFLELYPDFVERFNALLQPDKPVVLKKNERLNTELRIFALMKLGITDGDKLSGFLRCSQSTIYNYRARIRSRALNRDTFDQQILAL